MGISRLKGGSITLTLLIIILAPAFLFAQDTVTVIEKESHFGWGFTLFDLSTNRGFIEGIADIPTQIRQVPIHIDDPRAGTMIQLGNDPFFPSSLTMFNFGTGPIIKIGGVRLRPQIMFSLPMYPEVSIDNSDGTQEVNYQGNGRGTGSALIYGGVVAKPNWSKPGFSIEAEFGSDGGLGFFAGYRHLSYKLAIETGWDRYDKLETYKTYDIGSNVSREPYVGVRLGFIKVAFGPSYTSSKTDFKDMDIRYKKSSFKFAVSISANVVIAHAKRVISFR